MSQRRGVTLIEMLAVVVLIALTTAVLARGMISDSPQRELHQAVYNVIALDTSARSLARTSGPVRIIANGSQLTVLSPSNEQLAQRTLPAGWSLERAQWASREWLYVIESSGRSEDVELLLVGPGNQHSLQVAGLLGKITIEEVR